jgi:hypothetical protein
LPLAALLAQPKPLYGGFAFASSPKIPTIFVTHRAIASSPRTSASVLCAKMWIFASLMRSCKTRIALGVSKESKSAVSDYFWAFSRLAWSPSWASLLMERGFRASDTPCSAISNFTITKKFYKCQYRSLKALGYTYVHSGFPNLRHCPHIW